MARAINSGMPHYRAADEPAADQVEINLTDFLSFRFPFELFIVEIIVPKSNLCNPECGVEA